MPPAERGDRLGVVWIGQWANAWLQFCFPGHCAGCETWFEAGGLICPKCDRELCELQHKPACRWCAMPLAMSEAPCPFCLGKGPVLLDRIVRLGPFMDPLKQLIHQMKYAGKWSLAERLARRLGEMPEAREVLADSDVLIAVPLHPLRQMSRGYNQAAVMANELRRLSGLKTRSALARVRHTETQTIMHSHHHREENLRDAFGNLDAAAVEGRRVLLVDDVMTTGATLRAVARVIRQGKPTSVKAMVLAVANPRGVEMSE